MFVLADNNKRLRQCLLGKEERERRDVEVLIAGTNKPVEELFKLASVWVYDTGAF